MLKVLLNLSSNDIWSEYDAFEGTIIFGGNGSGKTSGSGKDIAMSFLKAGYGGIVLTVKVDEKDRWKDYAFKAGRLSDLLIVQPNHHVTINFLDYEASRAGEGGGITYDLVNILKVAMNGGQERRNKDNPFWDDAVAQLLTNSIDLCLMATNKISLLSLMDIIRSAPLSINDIKNGSEWMQNSTCCEFMLEAFQKTKGTERFQDFLQTRDYFFLEWAPLDERTRSNILITLTSQLGGILRSPFRQLFCDKTTFTPEDTFNGKIVILHIPIKEFGEVGRMAQILFKTIWQRAVERRGNYGNPVFMWADEAQYFVTKYDMLFQQTARSSRAASVYLTQSVVNFRATLDLDNATFVSDSLLGNLQTKIFHSNACSNTNEYAQKLFGEKLQYLSSYSTVESGGPSAGVQRAMLPILPANKFTTLKKGGGDNGKIVEGYVFQSGKIWKGDDSMHNKNWILAKFIQEF